MAPSTTTDYNWITAAIDKILQDNIMTMPYIPDASVRPEDEITGQMSNHEIHMATHPDSRVWERYSGLLTGSQGV